MRIQRLEPSRHGKGRFLAYLEDGSVLKLTEQELLDFRLRPGDTLDAETLQRLRVSAGSSQVRAQAAAMAGRRAMSRADLEKKLQQKGASEEDARSAADWLESIGALDDAACAAMIVRHYAEKGYGPARWRQELAKHGIDRDLWEDAMAEAGEAEDRVEQAVRFLRDRFRGEVPDAKERRRAADALARRGFSWGDVKEALQVCAADWEDA